MGNFFKPKAKQFKKLLESVDESLGFTEEDVITLKNNPGYIEHEAGASFNGRGIVSTDFGLNALAKAEIIPDKATGSIDLDAGSSVDGDGGYTVWVSKRVRLVSPLGIGEQIHKAVSGSGAASTPARVSIPAPTR
jgi:hypothetical protein